MSGLQIKLSKITNGIDDDDMTDHHLYMAIWMSSSHATSLVCDGPNYMVRSLNVTLRGDGIKHLKLILTENFTFIYVYYFVYL